jgi:uncharacterized protein YsxB (DUF464 family)
VWFQPVLTVELIKNGYIVTGHAEYAEHGADIVCSAVSVLAQTVANELQVYCEVNIQKMSGYMFVLANKGLESKILLDLFYNGIREIACQYPKYVQIKENFI